MSLSTRLLAFFLAALALILGGFSLSLYVLAVSYRYWQLDQRLAGSLDVLEGALHVEPNGMQWRPHARHLTLGLDTDVESVRWAILESQGQVVDVSANSRTSDFPAAWRPPAWPSNPPDGTVYAALPGWRIATRRLTLESVLARSRKLDTHKDEDEYTVLQLTVGLSPMPVRADLRQLATILTMLSAGIWLACASMGRYVCRRALDPIRHMAESAHSMHTTDPHQLLPEPKTGDELQHLARAFNELLQRFHAALEQQRRFAGDASHQLRTPLSGMLSLVEVTRRRPRSASDYEEALDRIREETLHMRQTVELLLFLARGDSSSMQLQTEIINLVDWVPRQLARWGAHPRADAMSVNLPTVGTAPVAAQGVLLAQLFDNLLDNACKYCDPGTPITISVWTDAEHAGFTVENTGPPIIGEDRERIFGPFFRALGGIDSGQPGAGLGLAIARKIIASLDGQIEVRCTTDRRTCFATTLKRTSSADDRQDFSSSGRTPSQPDPAAP